eukprot:3265840-Rhodomonas_salina.1
MSTYFGRHCLEPHCSPPKEADAGGHADNERTHRVGEGLQEEKVLLALSLVEPGPDEAAQVGEECCGEAEELERGADGRLDEDQAHEGHRLERAGAPEERAQSEQRASRERAEQSRWLGAER